MRKNDQDGTTIDPPMDLNYIKAAMPHCTQHEILVPAHDGPDLACGMGSVMDTDAPGDALAGSAP